jgi:hypothetical protein
MSVMLTTPHSSLTDSLYDDDDDDEDDDDMLASVYQTYLR